MQLLEQRDMRSNKKTDLPFVPVSFSPEKLTKKRKEKKKKINEKKKQPQDA